MRLYKMLLLVSIVAMFYSGKAQVWYKELYPSANLKAKHSALDTAMREAYRVRRNDIDLAMKLMQEYYEASSQIGYAYGMTFSMMCRANIIVNLKGEEDASPAIDDLRTAYITLNEASLKSVDLKEKWYTLMGAAFAKISEPDSAMVYYSKSLDIALNKKTLLPADQYALALNYLTIASIYFDMGQYDKVMYYCQHLGQLAQQHGLSQQLYRSYLIRANAFQEQNMLDSAKYYLAMLGTVLDYHADPFELRVLNQHKGNLALINREPLQAITFFEAALKATDQVAPVALQGIGLAYEQLENYPVAIHYLTEATKHLENRKVSLGVLANSYEHLGNLYDSLQQYKSAYHFRTLAAHLQRRIDNERKVTVVNTLEGQFRKAEQDKQIAEDKIKLSAAKQAMQQQKMWIGSATLLSVLLAIIALAFYQRHKLQRQRSESLWQHQEIEQLKAAIEAEERERSRIGRQLHDDIMVQLSIVKMNMEALPAQLPAIAEIDDFNNVKELLTVAGRDLRQTAHNLSPDTLLADGLIQALLYFFKNVQYRTRLAINFQYYGTPKELPQETDMNIYRITQELTQNIIKHAEAKNVLVQLSYRPDMLTLTVEDDGKGFTVFREAAKNGIGLKSIQARLKVMNGEMDIHERHPKGTSVTIELHI